MSLDSFSQSIISFNQHSKIMRKRIIIPLYKCRNSDLGTLMCPTKSEVLVAQSCLILCVTP